jgi:hypothetical protein
MFFADELAGVNLDSIVMAIPKLKKSPSLDEYGQLVTTNC